MTILDIMDSIKDNNIELLTHQEWVRHCELFHNQPFRPFSIGRENKSKFAFGKPKISPCRQVSTNSILAIGGKFHKRPIMYNVIIYKDLRFSWFRSNPPMDSLTSPPAVGYIPKGRMIDGRPENRHPLIKDVHRNAIIRYSAVLAVAHFRDGIRFIPEVFFRPNRGVRITNG